MVSNGNRISLPLFKEMTLWAYSNGEKKEKLSTASKSWTNFKKIQRSGVFCLCLKPIMSFPSNYTCHVLVGLYQNFNRKKNHVLFEDQKRNSRHKIILSSLIIMFCTPMMSFSNDLSENFIFLTIIVTSMATVFGMWEHVNGQRDSSAS